MPISLNPEDKNNSDSPSLMDREVSVFGDLKRPDDPHHHRLGRVLEMIRHPTDEVVEQITRIHHCINEGRMDEADAIKRSLPLACLSGVHRRRANNSIDVYARVSRIRSYRWIPR